MKLISLSIVAAMACTSMAFAQGTGGGAAGGGGGTKIPECQTPFQACQAAGYKVGAHKKGDKEGADNGLWVDCIDAVADGKKQVNGVDQTAAKACKTAAMAKRQQQGQQTH